MTRLAAPKTDREKAAAEFVLKGALTRLALMFQMSGETYTGPQVAEVLIAAWQGHERALHPPANTLVTDPLKKRVEDQLLEGILEVAP